MPPAPPGSVTLRNLDSTGNVGYDTSITIGADGFPIISYRDLTNQNLKVAKCGDASCSQGWVHCGPWIPPGRMWAG